MTEQENCGQALLDLEEVRMVTVGALIDMIEKLNAAFAEKLGKEPASGFNVEIKSVNGNSVSIWGGYESFDGGFKAVVPSTAYMGETPEEAFNLAMSKIASYYVPTKQERIKALQDELAELVDD